jgi:hypothetical protein
VSVNVPLAGRPRQGGPDEAGFTQIMQVRGTDLDGAKQLMAEDSDKWPAFRPEMIGSVAVRHDGGAYTMSCTPQVRPMPARANARRYRPSCRRIWRR